MFELRINGKEIMTMKKFENPIIEIDNIDVMDVIATSTEINPCPNKLPDEE